MNLRLDIQGLRALAVLFVVLFHFQHQWMPGGFIGVDMFFVVSGFLISKSMISQIDKKTFNYVQFIIGRVKRIVPAYLVMLIVVAIPSYFVLIPSDMLSFLYDLRTSLVFFSNQVFAEANNYFGAKSYEKSLLHTWSLSIEMQFYFLLPILLYVIPSRYYKWFFGVAALIVLFYTQYQIDVLSEKSAMYFSLLARSAEFMIGIGINLIPGSSKVGAKSKNFMGFFAIITLLLSVFLITENSSFPGLLAAPACLATAVIIWLNNSKFNEVLSWSPLVYIGTLSYSLYLWHWPILSLYRYYTMRYDLTIGEMVIALLVISLLTIASFYIIEEPFRKTTKKKVFYGVGVLASATIFLWYGGRKISYQTQEVEQVYTSANGFDMRNHANYESYFLMGDIKKADDKIVIIGDSHGLVMTGFFEKVGIDYGFNFSYISTNFVPPLEGISDHFIQEKFQKDYKRLVPVAKKLITDAKIIVVIKQWQEGNNEYFEQVLENLVQTKDPMQEVIVVSDFPRMNVNPMRKYKSIKKPKDFTKNNIVFPSIPQKIYWLVNKDKTVHLLQLKSEKYFEEAPYYSDTLMYYDEGHLNKYGSVNYAKFEGHKLAKLIEKIKMNNNADKKVANK